MPEVGWTAQVTIWQERFGKRLVQVVFRNRLTQVKRVEVVEVDLECDEAAAIAVAAEQRDERIAAEQRPVPRETNWKAVAENLVAELRAAGKAVDVEKAEAGERAITGLIVEPAPIEREVL